MNLAKTQTDPLAQLRQQLQRFTSHNLQASRSQDRTNHGPNSFDFVELLQRIGIQDLTRRFTGLSIQPCAEDELVVSGTLAFISSYATCEEIEDSYVNIPGYSFIRKDRTTLSSAKSNGGGVGFFYKQNLKCEKFL